jgi:hypothetical protein
MTERNGDGDLSAECFSFVIEPIDYQVKSSECTHIHSHQRCTVECTDKISTDLFSHLKRLTWQ